MQGLWNPLALSSLIFSFFNHGDALLHPQTTKLLNKRSKSSQRSMSLIVSTVEPFNSEIKLVLASQSPRRREILDMMGLEGKYDTIPSPLDELSLQNRLKEGGLPDPIEYTKILAGEKAKALAETLEIVLPTLVVGSDTIVDLQGKILEKPKDIDDAVATLKQLSAHSHQVHTGVAIYLVSKEGIKSVSAFTETANVQFAKLSDADIEAYVKTGEPMDKAGSYGIQGIGGQLVERIEGDYFTVMGLPMNKFSAELSRVVKYTLA